MARVLAISSHVVHGHVGLCATVPALQWLGHEAWAVPTVVLASRPGLGRLARHAIPPPELGAMLRALEEDGSWAALDAVLLGYFPSAAAVIAAAEAVGRIRQARPGIPVLVDPILGDAGRLYVEPSTAQALRERLLPLATIATPNLFEAQWLTGVTLSGPEAIAGTARRLGVDTVVVTSAVETAAAISTMLVGAEATIVRHAPVRPGVPNGAGDLFAGLFLGHLLDKRGAEAALDASLDDLDRVLAASAHRPVLDLAALWRAGT
jgi:pyridoxine kinase